jgi:hypothetical protein
MEDFPRIMQKENKEKISQVCSRKNFSFSDLYHPIEFSANAGAETSPIPVEEKRSHCQFKSNLVDPCTAPVKGAVEV